MVKGKSRVERHRLWRRSSSFPAKVDQGWRFFDNFLVPDMIIIMAENFTFPIHSAPFRLRLALEPLKKDRV